MASELTGRGDPARVMALLWPDDAEPGPRRGPKASLTVDRIVTAAVEAADRDGLEALCMRRVAAALGVGAMSLYTHVPGKAELVDLMLDRVLGEAGAGEEPAGGWRDRLEQVARDAYAVLARHPWAATVGTGRPILGPNLMAKYEAELAAVDGLDLGEVEMELVIILVTGFVKGIVGGLHEKVAAEQASGLTEEQWWAATEPHLDRVFDPERFPTAAKVGPVSGPELGAYPAERAYAFGLERLLDGVAVIVER